MFFGDVILKRSGSYVDLRNHTFSKLKITRENIQDTISEYVNDNKDKFSSNEGFEFGYETARDNKLINYLFQLLKCEEKDIIYYINQINDLIQGPEYHTTEENGSILGHNLVDLTNSIGELCNYSQKFFFALSENTNQEIINEAQDDTYLSMYKRQNNDVEKGSFINNEILNRTHFLRNTETNLSVIFAQLEGKATFLFYQNQDDPVYKNLYELACCKNNLERTAAIRKLLDNHKNKLLEKEYDDINNLLQQIEITIDLRDLFISKFFTNFNKYIQRDEIKIAEYEATKFDE